ncbi:unnamed protein product [Rotaria socialis]|uniref:J domain-containing protein n=4 Tax=Rotaria socialis TaxID=392032 RepID=A0A818AU63_9BILA|nr:unnamed protein product [Rotaria socialis]CAF3713710.1 unnamed protein product [Rotaria socialis]CAF3756412.1 unnamed protein product [Rotaria socialis]CAF3770887.1 unnamed protein product [Rotaria socialis]CAF4133368.1 unnamed protein product [Rotaria socialis]
MVNKDYYAILGVNTSASDDEIKRAYKQKALKHHPDKNRGDVEAEKKFMDISEAYEILSDPYKRSLYERFGSEELRNYLGADPRSHFHTSGNYYSEYGTDSNNEYTYDPYNNYFVRYKDPSTFYDLYVTLEEVNKGATRKIKVTRKRFNAELNATVPDEKLLEIQIKPGWKEGTKITFEGEGDEGDKNTIAGDIVFIIRDKPHSAFERSHSDLIYRVKLTLKQALLGTLVVIPFLDSTKAPYQFRSNLDIITPQTEKRFINEGLPYPKDPTRRGDLIVKFDILFPKALNKEQRTIVDCCFSNSIDFYQPHDCVYHNTIIEPIVTPEQPPPAQQQQQQSSSSTSSTSSSPSSQSQQQQQQTSATQKSQASSSQKPQASPSQKPQASPSQKPQASPSQKTQASPSQKPSIPNLNSTPTNKPQSTTTNTNHHNHNNNINSNNHHHNPLHHQNVLNRNGNINGHEKSADSPNKILIKNKISSVDPSLYASLSTSPATSLIKETIF